MIRQYRTSAVIVGLVLTAPGCQDPFADLGESRQPLTQSATCTSDCYVDWLWYEPSNGGVSGGELVDFWQLIRTEQTYTSRWTNARDHLCVFELRAETARKQGIGQIAGAVKFWNATAPAARKKKIAIDTGTATFAACKAPNVVTQLREADTALLKAFHEAEADVAYVGLQSILSKPVPLGMPDCEYTMENRIGDAVDYAEHIQTFLDTNSIPRVKFGLIDALIAKGTMLDDVKSHYSQLAIAMAAANVKLEYIHFDHPYEAAQIGGASSWTRVQTAGDFVEDIYPPGVPPSLQISAGLFHVAMNAATELEFHDRVIASFKELESTGAHLHHHVIASWYTLPPPNDEIALPDHELPETGKYTMTRNLLDLIEAAKSTNQVPIGSCTLDTSTGWLKGWTIDPDTAEKSSAVEIRIDGEIMGRFVANEVRTDVNQAKSLPGNHGFHYQIKGYAQGSTHTLEVLGVDSRELHSPVALTCSPMTFTVVW